MKILLIILLIITLLVLGLVAYKNTTNTMPEITLGDSEKSDEKKDKKNKKNKKKDEKEELSTSSFKVLEIYNLPEILSEVSDISHVKDNLFAYVQDELGTIFIYNADNNKIEREIPFAGKGDYEGIAWAGTTAYVINSSGVIYEVPDIENSKPSVKEYKTYLNTEDDVEALCFDKANSRLLLTYKAEEDNGNSKGIYSFDLKSKQLAKSPVYSIDLNNPLFGSDSKKKKRGIKPSAIAIHPTNGDIYITEGTNPKLLVLDTQGNIKSFTPLNSKEFPQPEGITFNTAGELFISNEGKKGDGNILKVKL